eukprot:8005497-Ditylum_brightwellii.AAC.1
MKRGFWQQENNNAFWSNVGRNRVDVGQQKQLVFEYYGTFLSKNKYVSLNLDVKVNSNKYKHLTN